MRAIYDKIGVGYSGKRQTDPKIAQQLHAELSGATRIINIGAGTGSYEPGDVSLVAVEPSQEMIMQRDSSPHDVIQANAESLPFDDKSFTHAMTVLSMHHWENRDLAFKEINRVTSEKFVALTWDPKSDPFWLTRDYFPEIYQIDLASFPSLDEMSLYFDDVMIQPLQIPHDCIDGFLAAFWKRPDAYLNEKIRQSISSFSKIGDLSKGLNKLKTDIENGTWAEKNNHLLSKDEFDVGYKIISARTRRV